MFSENSSLAIELRYIREYLQLGILLQTHNCSICHNWN